MICSTRVVPERGMPTIKTGLIVEVSYDDFSKLDLRVAKIESSEKIAGKTRILKDKEIVREQIKNWTLKKVENLIYKINEIELLIKKNSSNSVNILFDFIITQSNKTNSKI